ncbi:MAG: hypothetical protein EBR91_00600 [Flavobacteriia bacterium]|jgi:GMP synthase (glutamine-hydrolysing)|nr:hypothetical protein [Flavobacteriia bacterium]NBV68913.1 hypothetical protein [Flavobacteriia bacterium]NBV90655.1 hypothetical protein [Flavobacteriia bacterium]NBY41079.1 hypothetical protein [Flavobacteriia bacterium]
MKKILIIDCGSQKTPDIESAVDEYCDFDTVPFFEVDESQLSTYSGVIFSGAPILITEEDVDPFLSKINWVKEATMPILGICFGHQIIGLLFEAQGDRMKECRGYNEIEQFVDSPLLDRLPAIFEMMEDHCEGISIPKDFVLVANSDDCINEVMQHESKPIYGVQFHPEVSGNYGYILIENFVRICNQ